MIDMDYGKKAVIAVAIAAIAVLAFSMTFYFHDSNAVIIPQNQTGNYTASGSTGLELIVQSSSSQIVSGDNISITVSVLNTRGSLNVLNTQRDFPQLNGNYHFTVNPCNFNPYGIAIAKGNYSTSNLGEATPLTIFQPAIIMCPAMLIVSQYQFLAHSTEAKMYNPSDQPPLIGTTDFNATLTLSGYWTGNLSSNSFHPFSQGVYTVIAADGWEQVTLLHFYVS